VGLERSAAHKKAWGQYFTPPTLAAFAARMPTARRNGTVRVLDPGAGTGTLGLSLARALLERSDVTRVELHCVESEPHARAALESALAAAKREFAGRLRPRVHAHDFLDFATPAAPAIGPIDIVIANPPYFKLSPKDSRGGDAPNIYARFMEVSAALLRAGGELCFIIPRSYASGPYFKRFRGRFHAIMQLERVHLFESRSAAFRSDDVLQENIVVLYSKRAACATDTVVISASAGLADLDARPSVSCPAGALISRDAEQVLALPTSPEQVQLMQRMGMLPETLASLGLAISTGPVVPFRATRHLLESGDEQASAVPLLWLAHVRAGKVTWPLERGFRKPEFISSGADPKLLLPASNYVLLRRFSAKEEARRLTAAPLLAGDMQHAWIGLENHLNFIHRPRGRLGVDEAKGLAALLNSRVLDDYFRIFSGNTQVSATEIRSLPLPSLAFIERLGRVASKPAKVEQLIGELLTASPAATPAHPSAASPQRRC
jgi:adenine-specific DNA-methyltransferase